MLRRLRTIFATLFFIVALALFLDFSGTVHSYLSWVAKMQLMPAILSTNLVVIISLAITTLIGGRIYCSVICPLGITQDIISWLVGKRKKNRFTPSKPHNILRYSILAIYILSIIAGIGIVVALLDPYAIFGRTTNQLLQPLWQWGNNLLAYIAEELDSYAFYEVSVWIKGISTLIISAISIAIIVILAWRNGRTYCNTICPVGALLSLISRYSLLKIEIDTSKCNGCTLCQRNCKASCIDAKAHIVDHSRCVVCGNCIDKCHKQAISYKWRWESNSTPKNNDIDQSKRAFVATAALIATSAAKAQVKNDGGLASITNKQAPNRTTRIVPAGAQSVSNFLSRCVGCQLCVSVCPNEVLRPDLMLKPHMSYERGYCRPECTRCSEVCPAGAIVKVDRALKSSTQIGHAVWVKKNCIPLTDNVECGNCARHCPAGAIRMVHTDPADNTSHKIPAVNETLCIGCGACENLCPARPFSAIYVEGHEVHKTI